MENEVYLRPDVYFEPLYNKWFVWPYLMSPATAAMNVTNQHLKLMRSYIANAKIHAKSATAKSMTGSALINIPVSRVEDVKRLLEATEKECSALVELTSAIVQLDEMLRKKAKGLSMEQLYDQIPSALQGFVELQYDLNNQPSFRLIESLLYQSVYYKSNAQSACFGRLKSSQRPFVLSTPRLPDNDHLHINLPFNHPFLDKLFRMRETSRDLREITAEFRQFDSEGGLPFDELFTTQLPSQPQKVKSNQFVDITYLGHAGIMISTQEASLLIDPVIGYGNDDEQNKSTFADLPAHIDYVMVTHTHMDHLCLETLLQLRYKIGAVLVPKNNSGCLADPSIKLMLLALGFDNVIELEDLESIAFNGVRITALPFLGEHADLNIRSKSAWLVEACGHKILAAADSSNLDRNLSKRLHDLIGDIDMLFIGMECKGGPLRWLYGPLLTQPISHEVNESRRFNGSDYLAASHMARTFNASEVCIYALGTEPWYGYFMGISYNDDDYQMLQSKMLVDECLARGIRCQRLHGKQKWLLRSKSSSHRRNIF